MKPAAAWKTWGAPPVGECMFVWHAGRCAWCGTDRADKRSWQSGWDLHEAIGHTIDAKSGTPTKETTMPDASTRKTFRVTTSDGAEITLTAESSNRQEQDLVFLVGNEVVAEFAGGTWLHSIVVAEVAAAVRVAQENPRNTAVCVERMRESCTQQTMADRAFYSLPRAGGRVEGSTVHLARELAACWGNFDYGLRELRRDDEAGESEILAWAWDQERNLRSSRSFVVPHARMAQKKRQALSDLADIANNNNSVGSRAQREVIFQALPEWFVKDAEALCAATLNGTGGDKPLGTQVADMLALYDQNFSVTRGQLEAYLALPSADWTPQTLASLRVLGGELTRGEKRVADEFPTDQPARAVTAADVTGSQTT